MPDSIKDSENQDQQQNQDQAESEQPEDAVVLLARELQEIREALGIGQNPAQSSLLARLSSIEGNLGKSERERNLPPSITRAQAANPSAMRRLGVQVEDIASGKVKVEG